MFGFGIRSALVSGCLAARSIIDGTSFDTLWRRRLLPAMQSTNSDRLIYSRLDKAASHGLYWLLTLATGRAK